MASINLTLLGDSVEIYDSDSENGLELYHYLDCTTSSPEYLKEVRGVVLDKEGKIVMQSFPFTPEYTEENINEILSEEMKYTFYPALEGTILRLFFYQTKWYLSTHKKLNAFQSKWGCRKSFGSIFEDCVKEVKNLTLSEFYETLDKSKKYIFLVRNTMENRIVSIPQATEPKIYLLATVDENGKFNYTDHSLLFPSPAQYIFDSREEVVEFLKNCNPVRQQGLVAVDENGRHLKFVSKTYSDLFSVRGNEPNKRLRYLQVRFTPELRQLFLNLYPEDFNEFQRWESILVFVADSIYEAYVLRFIRHEFATVPKQQYGVLLKCHQWFLQDRMKNRISREAVLRILNKETPEQLNRIIVEFIHS